MLILMGLMALVCFGTIFLCLVYAVAYHNGWTWPMEQWLQDNVFGDGFLGRLASGCTGPILIYVIFWIVILAIPFFALLYVGFIK